MNRLAARFQLTDDQDRFVKRHLSSIIAPFVLFTFSVLSLPFALYVDPKENQVDFKGHLASLRVVQGGGAGGSYFYFSVKEHPHTFKAMGLSLSDQNLLMLERLGTEIKFTVEQIELEQATGGVPVLNLASPTNVYLRSGDVAALLRKSRYFAQFLAASLFIAGLWMSVRVRNLYRRRASAPEGPEYDPIVVAVAKNPQLSARIVFGVCAAFLLLVLPGWGKAIGPGVLSLGYGWLLFWFRSHGSEIGWIKAVLESEARHQGERPQTVAPKHVQAVELLVKSGRDVNICDSFGRTPIHIATEVGSVEAVDLLLKNGAQVDLKDGSGETALMIAAKKGFLGLSTKLLDAGADALLENSAGENALACAQQNKKNRGTIDLMMRATQKALAAKKAAEEAAAAEAAAAAAEQAASTDGTNPKK